MIKATIKICALIFGAGLFIPLSCTSSMMAGMLLFIELDSRDLSKGEKPHSTFNVLALPSGKNGSLEYLSLNQIDPSYNKSYCDIPPIDKKQYSFLLPHPEGKSHEREWEEDGYKVTTLSPGKQLIEIYINTDDYKFTSIYLAEEKSIKPLRSKCFGPGHVFQAALLAVFFAFGLYGLGRWLRHKYYPDKISVALRYTLTLIILGALVPLFLGLQIPLQFSSGSGTDLIGGYVSSTGMHVFWMCVYLFLAVGCWATAFLRVREYSYAIKATAMISTLLIIFIPFGTINFAYWFLHIRKKDGKKMKKESIVPIMDYPKQL